MSQDDVIEVLQESIWDVPYLLLKIQRVQALLEQYEADDREHSTHSDNTTPSSMGSSPTEGSPTGEA